ncbi:MAG: hypothetical protein OJF47_002555 [Nitrospira sp.]|nr:MAG: hypothetical protein OJF47_002555 [Nitrospira sp.]
MFPSPAYFLQFLRLFVDNSLIAPRWKESALRFAVAVVDDSRQRACTGSRSDDGRQVQLELAGLRRTLEWTRIQREQLLDRLDLLRLDNQRLQDRVEDLERRLAEIKQQQPLF